MKRWEGYEKGVNVGGWLSQCDHTKDTYENFVVQDDFKTIAGWGLDHVRVPVDYDLVEDKEGNTLPDGYKYIDNAITWCQENNLNMILDLHKTFGFSFDDGEGEDGFFDNPDYQERFYKLWEMFATKYGKYSDMLAFELLNEVTKKEYMDKWNEIADTCIKRIRKIAPNVYILVGGYYNNSIESLPALRPPVDDHIIYTFHCYEPLIFTHQGAYWAPGMDTSFRLSLDSTYGDMNEDSKKQLSQVTVGFAGFDPNEKFGPEYFEKLFSEAVGVAEERDVPLYCGEYGVINLADAGESLAWYKIINAAFRKHGIGRAAWNFRQKDFGLVDEHLKPVIDELLNYL